MTEDLLVTLDDLKAIRQISRYINSVDRLQPFIIEAQLFDIKERLGDVFYHDLITNKSETIYQDLLKGKTYTNAQNNAVHFLGLKSAIAYYAYARYILDGNDTTGPNNVVIKKSDNSEPVSDKTLVRKSTAARMAGDALMNDVIKFLNCKYTEYPKWILTTDCSKQTTRSRIYAVDINS